MKVADHSPNARRSAPKGRNMKCCTLGRTGVEVGDVPLDDERENGL